MKPEKHCTWCGREVHQADRAKLDIEFADSPAWHQGCLRTSREKQGDLFDSGPMGRIGGVP